MLKRDDNEVLADYVLDALAPEERGEFEARLSGEPALRGELDEWRAALALLAVTAAPVAPAADLRRQILERAKRTVQTQFSDDSAADNSSVPISKPSVSENNGSPQVLQMSPTGKTPLLLMTVAAVAAVTLIALILVLNDNRRTQLDLAQTQQSLRETQQQVAQLNRDFAAARDERDLLASPKSQTVTLTGTQNAVGSRAKLAFDRETGRSLLVAEGLPPTPPGKEYQVWFIADPTRPLPGKSFAPSVSGDATLRDTMPQNALAATVFVITLEPAGGVDSPTGAQFLKSST